MGGAIPGLMDSVRKQDEQAIRRKSVTSTLPWLLYQLLPPGSCPVLAPVLTSFDDELMWKCNLVAYDDLLKQ